MTLMTSCRQNNYTGHKDDNNLQAHILVRTVVMMKVKHMLV
jgi:hypothetical protein